MKLPFRHGIIRYPSSISGPTWLQRTSLSQNTVDINVGQEPVVFTLAHYNANYLMEETQSVTGAWGTNSGINNGPLFTGVYQYLYWDVNMNTGELTRGWTTVPPIISGTEPIDPLPDTHWFDVVNTRMRVFRKPNSSNGSWQDKIRLFAGYCSPGGQLSPYSLGSQANIDNSFWDHGHIILGANNKPLKQSDGTFATTQTSLIIHQTSGQNVKFDMALVFAQAAEEIPKYSLVSFRPQHRVGLASNLNLYSFVSGIVIEDLHQEEVGQIISNGVVRSEQWDFQDAEINKPLFCGVNGEVTLVPPTASNSVVQQVGYVYERDSIFMNIFPPVRIR